MLFQSLSGFLVRCNSDQPGHLPTGREVSIPIGFSGSLQPLTTLHQDLCPSVSIPIGFSGSLQRRAELWNISHGDGFNPYRVFWFAATAPHPIAKGVVARFQSLSGFLVRCNGDWKSYTSPMPVFQSLSGFLVRCNVGDMTELVNVPYCFNPYRVFWFAATYLFDHRPRLHPVCFNPYRVFWFAATS